VSTSTALIAAILTVVVAFITAIVTARTSRRATAQQTDVSLSAEARQWVTQAQSDAKEAKTDAAEARKEAQAAQVTAHDADIKLREVSSLTDGLLRWAERIVRAAHDPSITDARLREMVNGGPPELSTSRLQGPR
jgi:hypothetical protein